MANTWDGLNQIISLPTWE